MQDYDDLKIFQQMILAVDAPAYMRREKDVVAAWRGVLTQCEQDYRSHLEMPLLRVGQLISLAGTELETTARLSSTDAQYLTDLFDKWGTQPRVDVKPTTSEMEIEEAKSLLVGSFQRFNRRWERHIQEVNLEPVNTRRMNYNEYYLLEKECAVFSASVARQGYQPMKMATAKDLFEHFPLLRIPD